MVFIPSHSVETPEWRLSSGWYQISSTEVLTTGIHLDRDHPDWFPPWCLFAGWKLMKSSLSRTKNWMYWEINWTTASYCTKANTSKLGVIGTPLILALRRQRHLDLWLTGQLDLHSVSQTTQGNKERPCVKVSPPPRPHLKWNSQLYQI